MKKTAISICIIFTSLLFSGGYAFMGPQCSYFIHDTQKDFSQYQLSNIVYNGTSAQLELAKNDDNQYFQEGMLTSPILHSEFPFEALVLSWNGSFPEGTYLIYEVQVKGRSPFWSPWHEVLRYGKHPVVKEGENKESWAAKVDSDQLKMKVSGREFRYRIKLFSESPEKTPSIRMICASYANYSKKKDQERLLYPSNTENTLKPEWIRDLEVPFRSQLVENKDISWRACHPTSLAMALHYHGTELPTAEVAKGVWDPHNGIYGNWVYNAAYAGELGYQSYVRYCSSFDPIKEEIAKGNPVIISIKFGKGELENSPMNSTGGHIILVRGFNENGDPICNDPGTRNESTGHVVYKKEELEKAWITHSGAAVFVNPRKN